MVVKYMIFWWNFDSFALIRLGMGTRDFSRFLITNQESESWNLK